MPESSLRTPVVLAIFNRPDTTLQVFERVRSARPERLLVIADGPRPGRPEEYRLCEEARAVVERVDWPCDVSAELSAVNLGCRRRLSSGLNWAFGLVEEAIVLEDDCLPHPSFFRYCEELLQRYRDEERVMHISGDNFESIWRGRDPLTRVSRSVRRRLGASYYFSRYAHVWGWASWRRAWRHWEEGMSAWIEADDRETLLAVLSDPSERRFWAETMDRVADGELDSWAYQWTFACLLRGGLGAMPRRNLISNIGFEKGALHTTDPANPFAALPLEGVSFPLRHPRSLSRDERTDARIAQLAFGASPRS
ncbi:MAG TPA: hypothetical protein VLB79_01220 [Solirubrobacterales bacterium]|nr:hypothetical protein [Solirubrobacterales bacterium]